MLGRVGGLEWFGWVGFGLRCVDLIFFIGLVWIGLARVGLALLWVGDVLAWSRAVGTRKGGLGSWELVGWVRREEGRKEERAG